MRFRMDIRRWKLTGIRFSGFCTFGKTSMADASTRAMGPSGAPLNIPQDL